MHNKTEYCKQNVLQVYHYRFINKCLIWLNKQSVLAGENDQETLWEEIGKSSKLG